MIWPRENIIDHLAWLAYSSGMTSDSAVTVVLMTMWPVESSLSPYKGGDNEAQHAGSTLHVALIPG